MADDLDWIEVEVVYALADTQTVVPIRITRPTNIVGAIHASGILAQHPEIDLSTAQLGIFGQRLTLSAELQHGDRIEIYRPLHADPKQARKARALRQKKSTG